MRMTEEKKKLSFGGGLLIYITVMLTLIFVLLAVWLHDRWGWGDWVVWAGIALGVALSIDGLIHSLKQMSRLSKNRKDPQPPPISFNEHD